jgi:hypothetical protein
MSNNLKLKFVGLATAIAMFALPVADAAARHFSRGIWPAGIGPLPGAAGRPTR